jgi:hypothetical protein
VAGAIIAAVIGGIVLGVGWIWVVVTAFMESISQGLLCCIPFYAIYYAIKRWSRAKKPFVIYLVGVVILIVGGVGTCTGISREFAGVQLVIDEFMEAGQARDVEAAYACCSTHGYSQEGIADYIESNYDRVFAGYERLNISGLAEVSSGGITSCDVSGVVIYTGDESLQFQASLVKSNDIWRITHIDIGY